MSQWWFRLDSPSPPPPDTSVVYVRDCQFLDFLLNFAFPVALLFWLVTSLCRNAHHRTEPVETPPPLQKPL